MLAMRLVATALLSASFLLYGNPFGSTLARAEAAKAKNQLDHLHNAAHELTHAHTAATGNNGGKAHQHVTAAIGHIEAAIHHHKTKHLNQTRTGVTGALATAAHHHHHNQLHEALHAAKAAQKQLAEGNAAKASHDISKAHHHIELAIHSHHALIGK
jgi:hypothetical protein